MGAQQTHVKEATLVARIVRDGILAIIGAGMLIFLAQAFVFQFLGVSSGSMSPTLLPGDSVLVNRLAYHLYSPRRGDVIVFHFPQTDGRDFVKRVIGLPGDVVGEENGRFIVNGTAVAGERASDPVAAVATPMDLPPRRVPAGQLYVLGDNRATSLDSRFWGTVDEQKVVGKAVLICWSHGKHWWDVRWSRVGEWLR